MIRAVLLSVLVALSSAQSTQSAAAVTCTESTITISNAAQATMACNVAHTLLIQDPTITEVHIQGPTQIESLIVNNASSLVSLTSTNITTITGLFGMSNLNALSFMDFGALTSVGEISWIALNQLNGVSFGTQGVTEVTGNITISDTFLGDLDGLNLVSVTNMDINNNPQLVEWNSAISTINGTLKLQSNGRGQIIIHMTNLTAAGDMEVRDVKEFDVPALSTVGLTMNFEENEFMTTFSAPSLASVAEISFIDNAVLTNISMPKLTQTANAFTIQNNTILETINGFPNLATIRGAMILRGSFSDVELPSLQYVFGLGLITSTKDISSSCQFFDNLISKKDIQGEGSQCSSNNNQANVGGNNGKTITGGGGDNNSTKQDNTAASLESTNLLIVFALSAAGGILFNMF